VTIVQLDARRLGPADRVTAVRLVLTAAVLALVVRSWSGPVPVALLVGLAAAALTLDGVDGWVARRTGTASAAGARFDMEVDAALLLVLSTYVAPRAGGWVLLVGLARYLLGAARLLLPRLRGRVAPRRWRKVVAATQGVALVVVAAEVVPTALERGLLAVALGLLAVSFGTEAGELWRRHPEVGWLDRPALRRAATVLAAVVVWVALVLPAGPRTSAGDLLRIPLEVVPLVVLAVFVPPRVRRPLAVVLGVVLAVVVVLAALDLGFRAVLDRPFDPLADWTFLRSGVGVVQDSVGRAGAVGAVVGGAVAVLALFALLPWCVLRLTDVAAAHRRRATQSALGVGVVWLLCAVTGLQVGTGVSVASAGAAGLAVDEVGQLRADLHDRSVFAAQIASDPMAGRTGLLSALRGKDVLVVFVESYGRVAVQGTSYSPGVDRVLDRGTADLQRAGFAARSAFLTSPTYGAASWLAHSTLQTGLWVDSQRRYDQLLGSDRMTLTRAFRHAGWRTVFDVPANTKDWPEGQRFYGFDQLYDSRNVGYHGPRFSYATMPDEFTLSRFAANELSRPAPVFAEIDLVSSHHPWTPLPRMVPWDAVGDGSVYDPMPARGRSSADLFGDPDAVRAAYGASVEYSWQALVTFVQHAHDPNLVLLVLGDHQPHHYVSGYGVGRDVPVSLVAHDPAVLRRIADWGWQPGLRPSPEAPVWRMDTVRDRFLATFSPGAH
jgi:phosphatidylglycerophosphate synthase